MEIGFSVSSGASANGVPGLITVLKTLTLDADSFHVDDAPGTVIGAIGNRQPRSTLSIWQDDGSFAIDEDGNLVIGASASFPGDIDITITETLPEAANSPKRTSFTITAQQGGGVSTAGIAGTRFMLATGSQAYSTPYTSRRVHFAPTAGNITNLRCVEIDWLIQVTGGPVAGSARSLKKFIEYPVGVFHPVLWNGATQLDLPGTISKAVSDVVISSVTGQPLEIAADAAYYERTVNLTSISAMPTMVLPAGSTVLGVSDGNTASDAGNTGTINPTTGTRSFGSVVIICDILAANARSAVITGDSLIFGQGDVSNVGAKQSTGWWERLMSGAGIPTLKLAMPGISTGGIIQCASAITDLLSVVPYTEGWNETGVNDLTGGTAPATILANYQTIYNLFGTKPITQVTLNTRTTSASGNFDSVADQTPVSTNNFSNNLLTMNAAIRAGLANVDRVVEQADAEMSARDSNIHGGPFPPVLDGTHYTSAKAADIASKLVA